MQVIGQNTSHGHWSATVEHYIKGDSLWLSVFTNYQLLRTNSCLPVSNILKFTFIDFFYLTLMLMIINR